jgi:uncharacterized repeat protein (TIGR01451 family)
MNQHYWKSAALKLSIVAAIVIGLPTVIVLADPPVFTNVTDAAGLYYRDDTWGWAWGDYNDDGYIDLFLGNHPLLNEPPPQWRESALMRNNGDGTFTDMIHGSGISLEEDRHDMAWMDYDDDGDLDLWVSVGGRGGVGEAPNQLFRQEANGQFVEVAGTARVDYGQGRGRGTAWLDYDLDGDMDLYFTGADRIEAPNTMFRNNGNGTFTNVGQLGTDTFTGANSQVAVADYDNDSDPDMYVTGYNTRLYRNDNGQFTRAEESAGVRTWGATGAAWGDYDNDGDLDLFVSRGSHDFKGDYMEVSGNEIEFVGTRSDEGDEDGLDFVIGGGSGTFYLQQRHGGIVERSTDVVFLGPDGHHPASNPFTMDAGDVSGPPPYTPGTSTGLYVWQSAPGEYHIRCTAPGTWPEHMSSGIITADASIVDVEEVQFETPELRALPNQLFRNQGDGTFVEMGRGAGVADAQDCRSADWGDYDNDGYLDLFVQTAGYVPHNAPDLLYHNNGDGTFTNLADGAGIGGTLHGFGWGAIWADYDNDGFLDMFTSHGSWVWPFDRGRYELHHNEGNENHWLEVDLRGVESNSRGYGAKLRITAGGMTQFREVGDSLHYHEHYVGPIHVGLAGHTVVDELRVEWPSGISQILTGIPVNQRLTVVESSTPLPVADLVVTKDDAVDPVTEGDDVTYFVTVSNSGPDTAQNVKLTDDLPTGVAFMAATPSQGTCSESGGEVTCNLGAIASGTSADVTIVVNAPSPGTLTNVVGATSNTFDPNAGNNSASEDTTVEPITGPAADLVVTKDDAVDPVTEGDDVTYFVTVSNSGPDTAQNVKLTDDLPTGVAFMAATPSQGTCSESGGKVTCNLGAIASGTNADMTIVVNAPSPGTLTNVVGATSDTLDPNAANNSASEDTTVDPSTPPPEIIVDNQDPDFSTEGDWTVSGWYRLQFYGNDCVHSRRGDGSDRATFILDVPVSGDYEVSIWRNWCTFCTSSAPFTINHADGSTTVFVDLSDEEEAGQFESVGVFTFNAGTSGSIVLTDDADGIVVADAVRLQWQ